MVVRTLDHNGGRFFKAIVCSR